MGDPVLLPQVVARAVGIADQTVRDPEELLAEFLAQRQLLLVVDNCEHLVPAVSRLVVGLLRAAPGLRVMATSRESLQVVGEHLYPVEPLAMPAAVAPLRAAAATGSPAVALFIDRATAVNGEFALNDDNAAVVAAVCRQVDGLPLAIELAAARLRTLSLTQLAERLADRFGLLTTGNRAALPRHQTLRAAVQWSFELCSKHEQLLWMRAAVFAGSFDLPAAEAVCGGDGLPAGAVLATLGRLVDKSVMLAGAGADVDVDVDGRRYRLLDTLAEYGRERLCDPATAHHRYGVDEPMLRRRHRDFYLELAERFHADWFGPRQVAWSRRVRAELDNLRAALGYCLNAGDARVGVRLAGALHYLWYGCGEAREGRLWLERVLAADPHPSRERIRALAARARIALLQGEHETAADLARAGLEQARRFDEPLYVAEALTMLGIGALYRGDQAAAPLLERAVAHAAAVDPVHPQVAYAKVLLALVFLIRGDPQRAGELLADCRGICHAHGDRWYLGLVLFNSALQALALPDLGQAERYARESLELRRDLRDTHGAGSGLEILAWIAALKRQHARAARLLGAANAHWRSIGGSILSAGPLVRRDETAAAARGALGEAAFDAEVRRGGELTTDEAIAYALGGEPAAPERQAEHGDKGPRLTRREEQVAALLAEGLSNRQIAQRLVLSQRTVESHVENILTKLGFTSRTQVAAWHVHRGNRPE